MEIRIGLSYWEMLKTNPIPYSDNPGGKIWNPNSWCRLRLRIDMGDVFRKDAWQLSFFNNVFRNIVFPYTCRVHLEYSKALVYYAYKYKHAPIKNL